MRVLMILAAFVVAADVAVEAGPFRRYRRSPSVTTAARPAAYKVPKASYVVEPEASATQSYTVEADEGEGALAEVNAARAQRGLRPFMHDPMLQEAAHRCARIRAAKRIAGHLPNDFAHLPSGASADAAGCGAMEPSWGWGTCCTYENYRYAGAAWTMGSDGKRYMHLFVR
jgi:hypothetical protein